MTSRLHLAICSLLNPLCAVRSIHAFSRFPSSRNCQRIGVWACHHLQLCWCGATPHFSNPCPTQYVHRPRAPLRLQLSSSRSTRVATPGKQRSACWHSTCHMYDDLLSRHFAIGHKLQRLLARLQPFELPHPVQHKLAHSAGACSVPAINSTNCFLSEMNVSMKCITSPELLLGLQLHFI